MVSIYKLKPAFQKLLKPLLQKFYKAGITANAITVGAIVLSFLLGILLWNVSDFHIALLLVPIGLFIRMVLNALDGMMAKTYNMKSKMGEILNETGDIISDLFIYFPLIKIHGGNIYMVLAFIFLSLINEFSGVLAKAVSGTRRYDGPMGKSDRAFLVGAYCLLIYFGIDATAYSNYIFGAASLLMILSSFLRLKNALVK